MPRDNKVPYFPFYPDDFASDGKVEAMSTAAVGAYILLLCKAWRENPIGSIPDDDEVLARWTRNSIAMWEEMRTEVLAAFEKKSDGRFYQPRLVKEYKKIKAHKKKRSKAGKKGANSRWQSHTFANAVALAKDGSSSSSSSSSSDSKKDPPTPRDSDIEIEFVFTWNETEGIRKNLTGNTLSQKRKKSFEIRIRDPAWDWKAALATFPLLCFQEDPDPWRPDIDWFLRPDSVQKILEGKYDWRKSDNKASGKRRLGPGEVYDPDHKASF